MESTPNTKLRSSGDYQIYCLAGVIFSVLLISFYCSPLWLHFDMNGLRSLGVADWGYYYGRFEALRRTLVEFHQWPGHNPWSMGGVPLLGNATANILSIRGLLVIGLGTFWGLKLSILSYFLIGFWGAWLFARHFWNEPYIRLIFAFYTIGNTAFSFHMTYGHHEYLTFMWMPLFFNFLIFFRKDRWAGLKAGVVWALAFNESPAYIVQYSVLIGSIVFLIFVIDHFKQGFDKKVVIRWGALFVPSVLALTFYTATVIFFTARDFPRISMFRAHFSLDTLFTAYLIPIVEYQKIVDLWCCDSVNMSSYIGWIALFFFLISFVREIKWWHWITLLTFWAGIGNDSPIWIMYWIQKIPTFDSHLCFNRVRIFTIFFFGIGATQGFAIALNWVSLYCSGVWRVCVCFLGFLMIIEVLVVSHLIMKGSHVFVSPLKEYDSHPLTEFRQVGNLPVLNRPLYPNTGISYAQYSVDFNLGWLRAGGDPWFQDETVRIGFDEAGYKGEYHQDGKKISPVFWSPNRIMFQGLMSDLPLVVNLNPGNPWYNNGLPIFSEYKIVEFQRPFEVYADKSGVVELVYYYPGRIVGGLGTFFFFLGIILIILFFHKSKIV
jgi:hypothetical protein